MRWILAGAVGFNQEAAVRNLNHMNKLTKILVLLSLTKRKMRSFSSS